jgi:hypothetical protein
MRASFQWKALLEAAKLNWRFFIFAWLFPLFSYASAVALSSMGVLSERVSTGVVFLTLAVFVLFGWIAFTPYRRRAATATQVAFWTIVIPILIFCLLNTLPLKMPITMENLTSSNNRLE